LCDADAKRRHTEHAAACGHELATFARGAGVKHDDVVADMVETADPIAGPRAKVASS
jgi:hypothetical protein